LLVDLTAPAYTIVRGKYAAEPKLDVVSRLGRSTNKGDAIVMAWTAGPVASTDGAAWDNVRKEMAKNQRLGGHRPSVVMGRANNRRTL
jgi:hypothetical protein